MIEVSVARSAQEESPLECFRHEDEECPLCDGSGTRPRRRCEACGEPSGSISQGSGVPLVKDRRAGGLWYHVNCLPQTRGTEALLADLERMGG